MAGDAPFLLTVDLGTSGPKVALFTSQGLCLGYEFEKTPYYLLPNGGAEQNPDEWWAAIVAATRRLLARGLAPTGEIAALCLTTQWAGTVAVGRDGRPLRPAIIWMDARGAPHNRQITRGALNVAGYGVGKLLTWIRLTGGVPGRAGKDSIAHILYLKHQEPEVYRQTYKFLEPKDYLNLRLTGRYAASYDSITLHWLTDNRDLRQVDYHPRLLALAGIERDKLPDLKRAVDVLGPLTQQAAADLGLPATVQVVTGTPDVQSAAVGSGAVGDYEGHLYVGTSAWISCHVPAKKTDLLTNVATLPSAIPDRYLVANEQQTAGACLNYLRDNLFFHQDELQEGEKPPDVYQAFDYIAGRTPAGSGGLIFTPWLYGERTPIEDHTIRGGFHNLSLNITREHLIRAVFEGVAYNARWLLEAVEKLIRRPFAALNMIGGGANSAVWCQVFADVLNRPIRQVGEPILANARGAAYLAGVALNLMRFDDIRARCEILATFSPTPANQAIYDRLYAEFKQIYHRNRPIYARLNG